MSVTATDATSRKLGGVTQILITPFTSSGVKGETTYSLDNIIGDTLSISQEDPTTNEIECETRDEPLFENTTIGKITVSMESADIQHAILVNCLGFKKDAKNNTCYAPTTYKEIWAEIEAVFSNGDSLVAPKVKLRGSINASSLKTGIVKGIISGTCYTTNVQESDGSTNTDTNFYYKTTDGAIGG